MVIEFGLTSAQKEDSYDKGNEFGHLSNLQKNRASLS
jgi:hypothetical protein